MTRDTSPIRAAAAAPAPCRPRAPRLVRLLACGLVAGVLAGNAAAAEVEADDPLLSMLHARGLVTDASPQRAATRAEPPAGTRPAATTELVLAAMNFLDIQYRWGGNDAREGFDCSGFTRHVFATALGLALPRRAEEQAQSPVLRAVARDELEPGDLVFFNTLRRAFSHVGLYIGDGRFVHAPRSGALVRVERIDTRYWATRFDGARRWGEAAPSLASVQSLPAAPTRTNVPTAREAIEPWTSPH